VVDFGYEAWGKAPARFDLARLALSLDLPEDGLTAPPEQATLKVENWDDNDRPTLNRKQLPLRRREISRSLAIHPDSTRARRAGDGRSPV
jgi:hypothetical protein